MFQHLSHRSKTVRATVEIVRALQSAGPNTGFRKVIRMHKLIDVFAVVEHRNILALVNPFEEDLEDSQSAVTYNGTRPDNRDIQTLQCIFSAQGFSGELRSTILLNRGWCGSLRHRI